MMGKIFNEFPMTPPLQRTANEDGYDAQARAGELAQLLAYVVDSGDEEKRHLARQLHDKIGSSLTALSMHLSLLVNQLPADQALQDRAAHVKQLLATIIDGNRALQSTLWNDTFEFLGIKAALHELAARFHQQGGLAVRASLPEQDVACPPPCGLALLRCAEEGLRNVIAHAGATEVDIILDDNDDAWMLTIRDNGKGLDGAAPYGAHHGLRLLSERVQPLHGDVSLQANAQGMPGASLAMLIPKASQPASAA
jgi:signal transduction histidine kinase